MNKIDINNKLNLAKIKSIPNDKIAIFLPHCLRHLECPAKMDSSLGLLCVNCGKCGIGPFKVQAEEKGYNVFIAPGGSMVERLIEKNNFKAVIGVACNKELDLAFRMLKDKNIISLAVRLSKDGCVATSVNWDKVKEVCSL